MTQVKSKNRNRSVHETLDDSLQLAANNIGIYAGTIVQKNARSQGLGNWQLAPPEIFITMFRLVVMYNNKLQSFPLRLKIA